MNISTMSRPLPFSFVVACTLFAMSTLLPIVVAASAPAKSNAEAEAEKLATQAEQLLDSWRGGMALLTDADKLIVNALAHDPKSAHALAEKGRYLIMSSNAGSGRLNASNVDIAEVMFLKAAEADPKYARAYSLLGYIYIETGSLEAAKRALEKADQIGTNDPWLQLNWSSYWKAIGDQQRATAKCERAVDIVSL
jgi:tetratricopeptide (TPR) repeat protein